MEGEITSEQEMVDKAFLGRTALAAEIITEIVNTEATVNKAHTPRD